MKLQCAGEEYSLVFWLEKTGFAVHRASWIVQIEITDDFIQNHGFFQLPTLYAAVNKPPVEQVKKFRSYDFLLLTTKLSGGIKFLVLGYTVIRKSGTILCKCITSFVFLVA